jgi:hypothetical protein
MCLSLNSRCLVEDPVLYFQLVLDIQPQIDRTLDQTKTATNILLHFTGKKVTSQGRMVNETADCEVPR